MTELVPDPSLAQDCPIAMSRSNDRVYDSDYQGTIFTWDIDKTYLNTRLESPLDFVRILFEFALDKREIDGTVPLLKGLRRGLESTHCAHPIYFVSASPTQLRPVLARKMLLDGVEQDGITLKGQASMLVRGDIHGLTHHVGYKLCALMRYRLEHPRAAREVLFGDDSESDPDIYELYRKILAGELESQQLGEALHRYGEREPVVEYACRLAKEVAHGPRVDAIFIRSTGKKPVPSPGRSGVMYWITSPLQAAVVLGEMQHVDDRCVQRVFESVKKSANPAEILQDGVYRGLFTETAAEKWLQRNQAEV